MPHPTSSARPPGPSSSPIRRREDWPTVRAADTSLRSWSTAHPLQNRAGAPHDRWCACLHRQWGDSRFQGRNDDATLRDRLGAVALRDISPGGSARHCALRRHRRELRVRDSRRKMALVATSNALDQPFIFALGPGDPTSPPTWLHWSEGQELLVPNQTFNSGQGVSSVGYEHANSAFLCVGPAGRGLPHVRRQHGADAVRRMGPRPCRGCSKYGPRALGGPAGLRGRPSSDRPAIGVGGGESGGCASDRKSAEMGRTDQSRRNDDDVQR